MKRVQRMVARTMMMVMTIVMMTTTQTLPLDFGGADDGVNELDMLLSDEREDILEQMSNVCDAVTKVCPFFYLAINLLVNFPRSIIWHLWSPAHDHCAPCKVSNLPSLLQNASLAEIQFGSQHRCLVALNCVLLLSRVSYFTFFTLVALIHCLVLHINIAPTLSSLQLHASLAHFLITYILLCPDHWAYNDMKNKQCAKKETAS